MFFISEPWQGYRKHAMGSIKIITIANHERFFCLLSPSFIRRQQLDAWKKVSWRFHFLTYFNQFMNKYETALNASHFLFYTFNWIIFLLFHSTSIILLSYIMFNYDVMWRKNSVISKFITWVISNAYLIDKHVINLQYWMFIRKIICII